MRIHFPNAEHADVPVDGGRLLIGSKVSGDEVLQLPGLAAEQVLLENDPIRGIWLSVLAAEPPVLVNGRPVRERAHLRLGDQLHLGKLSLLVKPDSDYREKPPAPKPIDPAGRLPVGRASLRALSGQYFGKSIPLKGRTVIGRATDCDLVLDEPQMPRRHSVIENTPHGLYLRDLGSPAGTLVNGVMVRDTVLSPGDQVAFDQNRFLVEAPGWQPIPDTPTPPATPRPAGSNSSTQVGYKLVPPPPQEPAAAPVAGPAAPRRPVSTAVAQQQSSRLANWILALAALVTLVALGTVIYLTVQNGR